jgi:predicted ATPase
MPLTKGTALAVPHKDTVMRALAPEVRLLDMPDEIGHLSLHVRTLGTGAHKEILRESLENRTPGAKALSDRALYGTAEAVPFVQ